MLYFGPFGLSALSQYSGEILTPLYPRKKVSQKVQVRAHESHGPVLVSSKLKAASKEVLLVARLVHVLGPRVG